MPIYQWDGSSWRQVNSIWQWDGTVWRNINSGWQWDGGSWRQFFSSGTFQPEIRDASGNVIYNRSIGLNVIGYRGSAASGTYAYTYEYSRDLVSWSPQTAAGATGTLTGTVLTASYPTDASDLSLITSPLYNYNLYMRFKVVKSGETQYSQSVRIRHYQPTSGLQTTSGVRAVGGALFNPVNLNPYVNDVLTFWSSSDWVYTNASSPLTNNARPNYYIFTYQTGSGTTVKDSRVVDTSPLTPTNASKYTVRSGDLNSPIYVTIEAVNSNPNSGYSYVTTRNVDDGTLKAPKNLLLKVSTTYTGRLEGTWDESDGGNLTAISYSWFLYRNGSFLTSGTASGGIGPLTRTLLYTPTLGGDYRFNVYPTQSGFPGPTSDFSNTLTITPPNAFTYTVQNITSTGSVLFPGSFSINAFTSDSVLLNKWNVSWGTSLAASKYDSVWRRPDGTSTSFANGTNTTDYWVVNQTGNHTLEVTATNTTYQAVRVQWTKPAGTSAVSYEVNYTEVILGSPATYTDYFDDVTEEVYYLDNQYSTNFKVNYVRAYNLPAQQGLPTTGTVSGSNQISQSQLQQSSKYVATRTEYLALESVSAGTVSISGTQEAGQFLYYTRNSNWTPAQSNVNWNWTQTWKVTNDATNSNPVQVGTGVTIYASETKIGESYILTLTGTYKGISVTAPVVQSNQIVPAPPAFIATNNYNLTFTISSIDALGATYYRGTYTGGTIPQTLIGNSYTSPVISAGSKNLSIGSRAYKTILGTFTAFNSLTETTRTLTVSELGAFTYYATDDTATPDAPTGLTTTVTSNRVDINWDDKTSASAYISYINAGQGYVYRTNNRATSDDFWPITDGGYSYSGGVQSLNTNGIITMRWGTSDGAQSYKVNYTIGTTTTTSPAITQNTYTVYATAGTAFSFNAVTAYPNTTASGSGKPGTPAFSSPTSFQQKVSPGLTTYSITSLQKPQYSPPFPGAYALSSSSIYGYYNSVAGASSYEMFWYPSTGFTPVDGTTADFPNLGLNFTHTGRSASTTYYYWVRARNSVGAGPWSPRFQATTDGVATAPSTPAAPVNGWTGGTNYPVSWSAPSPGTTTSGAATITGYSVRVYQADSNTGTAAFLLTTIPLGSAPTSTTYTSPNASKYYAFSVAATNSAGLTSTFSGLSTYR